MSVEKRLLQINEEIIKLEAEIKAERTAAAQAIIDGGKPGKRVSELANQLETLREAAAMAKLQVAAEAAAAAEKKRAAGQREIDKRQAAADAIWADLLAACKSLDNMISRYDDLVLEAYAISRETGAIPFKNELSPGGRRDIIETFAIRARRL